MQDILLREIYDDNLAVRMREYQKESGHIYYTLQRIGDKQKNTLYMKKPIYAHICLTNRCNLSCPYCYADDGKTKKDMTYDEVCSLIEMCDVYGILDITWTGGEPFIREDFPEIVRNAHEKKIHQSILTNGTCVSADFVENLPMDNIQYQISFNEVWNASPEYKKNHDKIYSFSRKCTELGIKNLISLILEPREEYEIDALICEFIKNGVKNVRFGFLMPIGKCKNKEYGKYIFEMKKCLSTYLKVREKHKEEINIYYQFDRNVYKNNGLPKRFSMCEAATTEIYIDNNGDVYPCPLFKSEQSLCCGNVFNTSWENLWNHEAMHLFRSIQECDNCSYDCKVWCRGLKYYYDGKLDGKSYFCLHTQR